MQLSQGNTCESPVLGAVTLTAASNSATSHQHLIGREKVRHDVLDCI